MPTLAGPCCLVRTAACSCAAGDTGSRTRRQATHTHPHPGSAQPREPINDRKARYMPPEGQATSSATVRPAVHHAFLGHPRLEAARSGGRSEGANSTYTLGTRIISVEYRWCRGPFGPAVLAWSARLARAVTVRPWCMDTSACRRSARRSRLLSWLRSSRSSRPGGRRGRSPCRSTGSPRQRCTAGGRSPRRSPPPPRTWPRSCTRAR